ncbi:C-8 sterol [Hortaea werneckii]|uniref:C-8 sterol isomerase n=1 Tax=Hortaea werneckii TaxID=91943 RepID=A0A3M7EQF4_HORWE
METAAIVLLVAVGVLALIATNAPANRKPSQQYLLNAAVLVVAIIFGAKQFEPSYLDSLYIFDPKQLHDLSLKAIDQHGNDTRAIVDSIVGDLSADPKLANHVNLQEEWIFNNAGGAMGAMYIIHASITEYLIIFGTAIGTEGHTGRHTADDYFNILHGVQYAYAPGSFEPEVYPQGSVHHLKRGEVKQYSMREACFALEYARGWIPPMLGFGYADTFSSTLDFPTLWATTRVTGSQMIGNLLKGKV